MTTNMPFFKELGHAAGSTLVRDMMVVRFEREGLVIGELGMVFAFDSTIQNISELMNLQTQDLTEVSTILVNVMKKQKRAAELLSFIQKLKAMPY
ncbi:hypothetical protein CTI12_AA173700 [Artemisia annua]|uniref:Uncharacterized protein n=1 Tax=Artemisia annua TaxID=35608 RepID=A0A2U1PAA2_ARTAN|nr:hypothetical protein CTI12_AA173700 [Artemisia annua]